jgi:hypothetical protein
LFIVLDSNHNSNLIFAFENANSIFFKKAERFVKRLVKGGNSGLRSELLAVYKGT